MDVIYFLGNESRWQDNELRYSLRSIEKNLEQPGRVWIIGHKPEWVRNVRHIPFPDPYKSNKDANLILKLIRVAVEPDLSDRFIAMSDDHYVLKPTSRSFFDTVYYQEKLVPGTVFGQSKWSTRLKRTFDLFHKMGQKEVYNCEGHIPYMLHKQRCLKLLEYDFGHDIGYTVFTLYFNSFPHTYARIDENVSYAQVDSLKPFDLSKSRFVYNNDLGLTPAFKQFLSQNFDAPSSFE